MPLDARKAAHIQAKTLASFANRQKAVVFVYQNAGVYMYVVVNVIFRPQQVVDPQIPNTGGSPPKQAFDLLLVAPLGTNFVGVVYVADTATATASAVAAAAKYEVIEAVPVGLVPGGTHVRARLRRLR